MDELDERLDTEISLLESMYPDQIVYSPKARELNYRSSNGKGFLLRLPAAYLESELPEVLSAHSGRIDLREKIKQRIHESCQAGEEVIDSIIAEFDEITNANEFQTQTEDAHSSISGEQDKRMATIVVYLHHLLNTNKRKQCLSPSSLVSGITKPGYPGVLVYSGPAEPVHNHVNDLKALNWAAFQIRLEIDEEWVFAHGKGVIEVETMGEVVAEVGEERKTMFMEAMRMK